MFPSLDSFAPDKQRRLDLLLDRNAEGAISEDERAELEDLVAEAERLIIANSRELADFARSQSLQPPPAAVPVTVWVAPHPAES
ncbi:MAG: hypothetical protein DCC67_08540 [Planctomycetota bacterium]|nr:MAG: hypothetical protein DCC67_08540 [Planctomycetota bacterium]